ncbi:MAG: hypothetical protein KDH94_03750 [Coxiellaceae bacterium]|nr:hypothetical protein [Coxiellaceae bacterium]
MAFSKERFIADSTLIFYGVVGAFGLVLDSQSVLATSMIGLVGFFESEDHKLPTGVSGLTIAIAFYLYIRLILVEFFDKKGQADYEKQLVEQQGVSRFTQALKYRGSAIKTAVMTIYKGGDEVREMIAASLFNRPNERTPLIQAKDDEEAQRPIYPMPPSGFQ